MANTPSGGVLIVGVEDSTGALLGTTMDPERLRQRIYQRVDDRLDLRRRGDVNGGRCSVSHSGSRGG